MSDQAETPKTTTMDPLTEAIAKGTDRLSSWLPDAVWRYRRELYPMAAAIVLWSHLSLIIWGAGALLPSTWTFVAGAAVTAIAGPLTIRHMIKRHELAGSERTYILIVGSLATAWGLAAWTFGSWNLPMGLADLTLGVGATIPWAWRLHGRRSSRASGRVKMPGETPTAPVQPVKRPVREVVMTAAEKQVRRIEGNGIREHFATAAKAVLGASVNVMSIEHDATGAGWTMRVQAPGLSVETVSPRLRSIESHLDDAVTTRVGALQAFSNPHQASQVFVRYLPTDPLAKPIRMELEADPLTITEPLEIGLWDDMTPIWLPLLRRHALIGGMTGAGKSAALGLLLYQLGRCTDVGLWGIDLKNGIELGDWRPRLDRLVTTPAEAVALLQAARNLMDRRGAIVAATPGIKVWPVSPDQSQLFIVVDEYSQLPPEAKKLAEEISQLGRAQGVQLLIATQKPLSDDVGSILPSQCAVKISLKVAKDSDGDVILGQGHVSQGWRASRIGSPGYFLGEWPEHTTPNVGRFLWLDDLDQAVRLTVSHRPELDEPSAATSEAGVALMVGPPEIEVPVPERVIRELEIIHPGTVTFGDLMARTGASKTTLHGALTALVAAGKVEKAGHGTYRLGGLV